MCTVQSCSYWPLVFMFGYGRWKHFVESAGCKALALITLPFFSVASYIAGKLLLHSHIKLHDLVWILHISLVSEFFCRLSFTLLPNKVIWIISTFYHKGMLAFLMIAGYFVFWVPQFWSMYKLHKFYYCCKWTRTYYCLLISEQPWQGPHPRSIQPYQQLPAGLNSYR